MITSVPVSALEAESVGAPELLELSFAGVVVGLLAGRGRRPGGHRWWWAALRLRPWTRPGRVQLLLLNACENGRTRDAVGRLQPNCCAQLVLEAQQKLSDEEFVAERWVECQEMIHVCIELLAILADRANLTELQQFVHLHLKFVDPELLLNRSAERIPTEAAMCLAKCLKPVSRLPFNV